MDRMFGHRGEEIKWWVQYALVPLVGPVLAAVCTEYVRHKLNGKKEKETDD